jgi:hypothetical protein
MANTSVFANSTPRVDVSTASKEMNRPMDPAGDTSDPATTIGSPSLVKRLYGSTRHGDEDQNLSPHTPLRSRRPSWEIPSSKLTPHRDNNKRLSASCHTSIFSLSPKSLGRKSHHKSVSAAGDDQQQKQRRNTLLSLSTPNKQKSGE